jgi:hypothetical protein
MVSAAQSSADRGQKPAGMHLSASWQFKAAMLSRPADLSSLMALSRSNPSSFFIGDEDIPHKLVTKLLNSEDDRISTTVCLPFSQTLPLP